MNTVLITSKEHIREDPLIGFNVFFWLPLALYTQLLALLGFKTEVTDEIPLRNVMLITKLEICTQRQ